MKEFFLTMTKNITFEKLYDFCSEHRVEVLLQDDLQYHCFIDYPKEKRSWAIELDTISALIFGIQNYKQHHENSN